MFFAQSWLRVYFSVYIGAEKPLISLNSFLFKPLGHLSKKSLIISALKSQESLRLLNNFYYCRSNIENEEYMLKAP